MKTLFTLLLLILSTSFAIADEKDKNPYIKHFSVKLSYSDKDTGSFKVILKNISDKKLSLMLNLKSLEGEFILRKKDKKIAELYEKSYYQKLLTSTWFSGVCDLEPRQTKEWELSLDELSHHLRLDKKVTKQDLKGMNISFKFNRLAVFPALGKSNVYVYAESNTIDSKQTEKSK